MPEPTLSEVHVDQALTDYSRAYFQAPGNHIWNQVFGMQPSPKQSNKYHVYDKDELLRTDARKRAPGTEAPVRGYALSQDDFYCDVWSVAVDVSEQIRENSDPVLDPEEDAARVTVQDINIAMDVEFASKFFVTGVWGTSTTPSTLWDVASSTPIEDIATGVKTILQNTGYMANTLVLGAGAWYGDGLMNHPDIIARLPDNAPRIATPAFLGNLLGIDRVFVARSIRNTAAEGLTGSYSFNLGDHALLCYAEPNPGPRTPTAANVFYWSGLSGSQGGIRTKRMDMPWQDALPRVESDVAVDFKIVGSDLGYMFVSVVS